MLTDDNPDGPDCKTTEVARLSAALVVRSSVEPKKDYTEYKPYLRRDFLFSCAYCSMSESEATARRFTIDHYEPVSARPDLETDYLNLMYVCDSCNSLKGDRTPPPAARQAGIAFFRPDEHAFADHFERDNCRLKEKSGVGNFTIEALDLNRDALQRLRDIRLRISECDEFVAAGVRALRAFPIDQLPPKIRTRALETINRFAEMEANIVDDLDALLKNYAISPLDPDEPDAAEGQRNSERLANLRKTEALFPGVWRGRRLKRR